MNYLERLLLAWERYNLSLYRVEYNPGLAEVNTWEECRDIQDEIMDLSHVCTPEQFYNWHPPHLNNQMIEVKIQSILIRAAIALDNDGDMVDLTVETQNLFNEFNQEEVDE